MYTTTLLFAACGGTSEKSEESVLPAAAATAPVRAIMAAIIDPAADVVWESVATIATAAGIEERVPKTDEEWANVRRNALVLVEGSDLLLTPDRPMADPGEKSAFPGVELEPSEILANVNKDRESWNQRVKAFHDASVEMLRAIDAKDRQKIFDLGAGLDATCENCHTTFWYPNQPLPPGYNSLP